MNGFEKEIEARKELLSNKKSILDTEDAIEKQEQIEQERYHKDKKHFKERSNEIFKDSEKYLYFLFNEIDDELMIRDARDLNPSMLMYREGVRRCKEILEDFLSSELILKIIKNKHKGV